MMAMLINGRLSTVLNSALGLRDEYIQTASHYREKIPQTNIKTNRYELFSSYACPWAHGAIIVRNLKKLQKHIPLYVTDPYLGEKGWTLTGENKTKYLAVLYVATNPQYTGRISVPLLWDNQTKKIVNNEASDILRMLNSSFNHLTNSPIDLYPYHLRKEIDEINSKVFENINSAVYKTGLSMNQRDYEENFERLFIALEDMDMLLKKQSFLVGDKLTEADIRLFTTLIRFDLVYYLHFKCNLKQLRDYHYLYNYMKSIYQLPEIRETCRFKEIKEHYYKSYHWINPTRIIPKGPEEQLETPHDRVKIDFYELLNH